MNRKTVKIIAMSLAIAGMMPAAAAFADDKAKFYDFSDQLIDGEIKKPTTLYMESRQRARFDKLLKLKKSFRPTLIESAKERTLK
jgi:hypothetical protein